MGAAVGGVREISKGRIREEGSREREKVRHLGSDGILQDGDDRMVT